MKTLPYDKKKTAIFKLLLNNYWMNKYRRTGNIWRYFYDNCIVPNKCHIQTNIHGYPVLINNDYTYPLYSRKFTRLNNPLVELIYQAYKLKGQIAFIDVGAAIGDTLFLLKSNCPNMIKNVYCIDGDEQFYKLLLNNTSGYDDVVAINAILSSHGKDTKSLIRIHGGTASAQGDNRVKTETLDGVILKNNIMGVDVMKVDVDGFDAQALTGGIQTIKKHRPAIIFEWHPIICANTGNDPMLHFKVLEGCGYTKYLWFTKYGDFSHFMQGKQTSDIEKLARLCTRGKHDYDWHYDIVALHDGSEIPELELAEMSYAKLKKSPF